jgi:hypothetical protein
MMAFPYCVGNSGQPTPSEDNVFQWVKHRLGGEQEPFFVLEDLKTTEDGMVFGALLRELSLSSSEGKQYKLSESVIRRAVNSEKHQLIQDP